MLGFCAFVPLDEKFKDGFVQTPERYVWKFLVRRMKMLTNQSYDPMKEVFKLYDEISKNSGALGFCV